MVVGYCFPAQVIRVFTNDEVVVAEGVLYLRVAVFAYVAQCVNTYGCALLRATEEVRLPMISNIIAVLTNTFLNWVFIYGNLGAPAMGVRGAALATAISSWVGMAIMLIVSYKKKNLLALPAEGIFPHPQEHRQALLSRGAARRVQREPLGGGLHGAEHGLRPPGHRQLLRHDRQKHHRKPRLHLLHRSVFGGLRHGRPSPSARAISSGALPTRGVSACSLRRWRCCWGSCWCCCACR